MLMFNSLIDGEWMSDGARSPNVNPSDTNDVVGEAVRGTRAQAEAAVAAAKAAFPAWSRSTPQLRYDILKKASDEILAAQGRTRPAAVARGRQDPARRHRRGGARRPDLRFLRRRMPAHGGRDAGLGASRRRRRDHPRSARRRRPDHAVEFPDRDPGLEDRAGAGLRQHRGDQAGRSGAGFDLGAGRHPASRRPAQGRAQPRHGPRLGRRRRRCWSIPTSPPSPSPARSRPAARSPRPASRRVR